ncbi:hypothetical protein V1508DRAFT_395711 [Lipomyces doorenjongii]|uniref:uncharacterized protein n=1 Tax=Lipomyces doorenjongii TaxID=383834 RepID=UPI0034CF55BF
MSVSHKSGEGPEAIETFRKPWLEETPYDIWNAAMDDLLKAFASEQLECFQETIGIHSKHWTRRTGKFAFLRYMKCAEKLPEKLYHDSRLAMERPTGHFYLCVPGPLEVVEGPAEVSRVVALDPGVGMFMTAYTPDGEVIELGKRDIGHFYRLCHSLDVLHSRLSMKGLDYMRRRRAAARIRPRIRNLVDDLHPGLPNTCAVPTVWSFLVQSGHFDDIFQLRRW